MTSPTFGFNLEFKFGDIGIQSGLNYGAFESKYKIDQYSVTNYDSLMDNSYYQDLYDSNGVVYDSVYVMQFDTTAYSDTSANGQLNYSNSYNMLRVPLRMSYSISAGKWTFVPYLGVEFNFMLGNPSGTYLQNELGDVASLTGNKFSVSYQASFQIRREIGSFHLFMEPIYNGTITPVIDQSATIVKYNQLGLRLGLGVKF